MRNKSLLFFALLIFSCLTSCMKSKFNFPSGEVFLVKEKVVHNTFASENTKVEILTSQDIIPNKVLIKTTPKEEFSSERIMIPSVLQKPQQSKTIFYLKNKAVNLLPTINKEVVPEKEVNFFTLFLLAAFFPPLAVGIKKSFRSWHFFLTIGLTLTFFFPGMVYAIIQIIRAKNKENKN